MGAKVGLSANIAPNPSQMTMDCLLDKFLCVKYTLVQMRDIQDILTSWQWRFTFS